MTLNQMKYFIAVARSLSFSEAARSLYMTQPALSRQIQAMEEELGTMLFFRDKKSLKLTPGGMVLYNGLPDLLQQYQLLAERVSRADHGFEGQLRIGVLDVYDISELFPPVTKALLEANPGMHLTLERFSLGELTERLYADQLDLICTYAFSLFNKPDLISANVQPFETCVVMHRGHRLAGRPDITLADLNQERFVLLKKTVDEEGAGFLQTLLEKHDLHPDILYVDKLEDVLLWVQIGHCVSVTTTCSTDRYHPDVVVRPLGIPRDEGHNVTMAWRKSSLNPAIAIFMDLVEKVSEGRFF